MKAYPVKHLIVRHSLKKSSSKKVLSPASHSLIVFPEESPPWQWRTVSSSADSSKIQLLSRRVQQEKWGTLSTLSGPVVGPGECISVSHLHTNNFSNRRLRLYCFTKARQVDIEMMIYTDLSFQVSLAHTFSRAVHTEGPCAQFWTTAHIGCFWMTLQDVTHIRYKQELTARANNRHLYMCLHFSCLFGKHFTSVLWNFDWSVKLWHFASSSFLLPVLSLVLLHANTGWARRSWVLQLWNYFLFSWQQWLVLSSECQNNFNDWI